MTKVKFFALLFSLFFLAAVYGLFVIPVFAAAPKLELSYPGLGVNIPSVPDFVAWIFKFALGASGALAFGVLVFGGIKYITSAGNASAQGDAKQWIQGALLGLLLLLGSVLILGTINPSLTTFGVPPAPNFSFNGKFVILEPTLYEQCMRTNAPASCGCDFKKSVTLTSGWINCPSYKTFPPPGQPDTALYCTDPFDVCVDRMVAGSGIKEIYCCAGPVP